MIEKGLVFPSMETAKATFKLEIKKAKMELHGSVTPFPKNNPYLPRNHYNDSEIGERILNFAITQIISALKDKSTQITLIKE